MPRPTRCRRSTACSTSTASRPSPRRRPPPRRSALNESAGQSYCYSLRSREGLTGETRGHGLLRCKLTNRAPASPRLTRFLKSKFSDSRITQAYASILRPSPESRGFGPLKLYLAAGRHGGWCPLDFFLHTGGDMKTSRHGKRRIVSAFGA